MEIVTKKINTANAIATGVIALKDLEDKMTKVAVRLSKTMKLDGFRKGKVPLSLIRARYAENIKQDAQKEAVQGMLQNALKELNANVKELIGDPVITRFEQKENHIDVEIKISFNPEVRLDNLESCIPEVKIPEISAQAIDERLDQIAKRQAPFKEAPKDKLLENGDNAVFDFEGFVDHKAFEGGKAENYELIIGSAQFIPGFEDGMLGMKAGENRDIKVNFPKNYQVKNLAGREATFKIKLHAIKVRDEARVDEELAKKLLPQKEDATLSDLKEQIKTQLEQEAKMRLYNEELKEELVNNLAQNISFDLPDLVIEQEMDMLFRNFLNSAKEEEIGALQSDANKAKAKRESFREHAQKSVKVTFIIDALAKQKSINVQDNEVFQTLYYEAMMTGQNPQEVIEHYKNNNLLPVVKMAMIEDRILQHLLDSKITKDSSPEDKKQDQKKASPKSSSTKAKSQTKPAKNTKEKK